MSRRENDRELYTGETDDTDWSSIGQAAFERGDQESAILAYQTALKVQGETATIYHNLALVLCAEGHRAASIACYRRALALDPDDPDTWSNLGNVYRMSSRYCEAENCLRKAIELSGLDPDFAFNLGLTLRDKGCADEAVVWLERASQAYPESAEMAFELAITRLQLGQLSEGFSGYERRKGLQRFQSRRIEIPEWDGGDLNDRSLLVYAEQGLGDQIQFARFIPQLQTLTEGKITLECHPSLKRLFSGSFPEIEVISEGEKLSNKDLCVSIMSLAHLLDAHQHFQHIKIPYLNVHSCEGRALPQIIKSKELKVGINWAGKINVIDRSCPFEEFISIAEVPNVQLYSLQRGIRIGDIGKHGFEPLVTEIGSSLEDFADDAVLVKELDLIITIDTAMCHLAGAIGAPTWTLLIHEADWRFHQPAEQSAWYPTMRLFRQPKPGDWSSVINDVKHALSDYRPFTSL